MSRQGRIIPPKAKWVMNLLNIGMQIADKGLRVGSGKSAQSPAGAWDEIPLYHGQQGFGLVEKENDTMTIDEAIERLDILLDDYNEEPCPDEENAIKLGIEALKRVYDIRRGIDMYVLDLLPGETKAK